jgi:DNA-binding response OmpR family regulator
MPQQQGQRQTRTILVVEDDEDIGAFLIETIVQETPYQFALATHSQQALQLAREIKPILFILNYHLPGMNGLQLYDYLHAIEGLAHVPAIMISAVLPELEVKKRKIAGITKPFDLSLLLDTIEQLLA